MKSDLICKLCEANLGYLHGTEKQFVLLAHYRQFHPSELEHVKALGKEYIEYKGQYGLGLVFDLMLLY